jgi:Ca-activated chloride channel family protein
VIVPPLSRGSGQAGAIALLALLVLCPALGRAFGQFSSGVNMVEVYATVTDSSGRLITTLRREDFTVDEDGTPQTIQAFAAGEFPLSVAIGVDRSFSMSDRALAAAVTAARTFIDALTTDDQVMVLGIGSETEVLAPLSADRAGARRALERLARWGTTPLFDAAIQTIDAVQPAPGRRALVLLSDGEDRYSVASAADVIAHARRHDVLVYPIAFGGSPAPVWAEVAAVSGGRSFAIRDDRELDTTLAAIHDELRHQYLIGYAPTSAGSGWRSIRVRVKRPRVQIRARGGYFAGGS